jgi:shikimate dehydrogenase
MNPSDAIHVPTVSSTALDRYAVLGHPVAHSQSPFIHAAFAAQTGQALTYDRVLCPLEDFAGAARAFFAGGARGASVTVPFKFEALRLADRATDRARLAGAANTLALTPEGLLADNTDGVGLMNDLVGGAGCTLTGARVLVVGAGGAAAGVLGPLLALAPGEVALANRTVARAEALVMSHQALATTRGVKLRATDLSSPGAAFDVVINASASSLAQAAVPVAGDVLRPGTLAVDLMYGPAAEPFLRWAGACGAQARDGLGMLVEQAAEAFALWRGVRPQTAPVLAALRERVASAAKG